MHHGCTSLSTLIFQKTFPRRRENDIWLVGQKLLVLVEISSLNEDTHNSYQKLYGFKWLCGLCQFCSKMLACWMGFLVGIEVIQFARCYHCLIWCRERNDFLALIRYRKFCDGVEIVVSNITSRLVPCNWLFFSPLLCSQVF